MSGFPILDLILGLVFIFFVLSIISSAIVEVVLANRNVRSKILTKWLFTIFDKKLIQPDGTTVKLGQAISDHCLTTALAKPGQATSFMDARNFVSAMFEKLTFNPEDPGKVVESLDQLLDAIRNAKAVDGTSMLSTELTRTILMFGSEAKMLAPPSIAYPGDDAVRTTLPDNISPADLKNSFQIFREKMENWFDSSMDRITGRMKKKYVRPLTFWVGLIVTISLNADTIKISRYLYEHKEEAKVLADNAAPAAKYIRDNLDSAALHDPQAVRKLNATIDTFKNMLPSEFPLGWDKKELKSGIISTAGNHVAGWLATVMAIMLGAPFWFDLLNKFSNIRGAGNKPVSSTDQQRKEAKL